MIYRFSAAIYTEGGRAFIKIPFLQSMYYLYFMVVIQSV